MRNLTRLVAVLLMGASLPTVSLMAQNDPEPGTSFTSSIVNPGFDRNSSGWTITGATGAVSYQVMEVFNSNFDLSQTITGLPAGTYQLTADGFRRAGGNDSGAAYNDGTEKINMFLYAKTTLREKKTPFFSLYSITGLTADGVSGEPILNGYLNNMGAAAWAFENGHYTNNTVNGIVVGNDGNLTIGIRTEGDNVANCWAIWDNFNLTYMGPAGLAAYTEIIEELENSLYSYDESIIPSGNLDEIQKALAYSQENSGSSDTKILQEVIDSLTNVSARAESAALAMTELINSIESASIYIALNYEGKEALIAASNKAQMIIAPGAVDENGDYIFGTNLTAEIATLNNAIRTYRFNEPIEDPTVGVDFTWVMQSPNFTKPGGDPSNSSDAVSTGWVTNNVANGGDFRLNTIGDPKKNCWNNWSNDFTSMDVYQELENMPAGLYTFECVQTNNGEECTDQHSYITALGGTAISPYATYTEAQDDEVSDFANAKWEGPLQTEKILVGDDGKIRVGFASTSNKVGTSGWFCFTDCVLRYYGPGSYDEAMVKLIESAELLTSEEMLLTDQNALQTAIAIAKEVDTSDKEVAEAGMAALNEAISKTNDAISTLASFKAGSYAKALEIAEDPEGVYNEDIVELMSDVVLEQNGLLESETIVTDDLPELTATLDKYLSFVNAYSACEEYVLNLEDPEIASILIQVLDEQTAAVSESIDNIDAAKATFTTVMSFSDTYMLAMKYAIDEEYPEEARVALALACQTQLQAVTADYSVAANAEAEIAKALGELRKGDLIPGDNTDVTSFIVNADLETGNESTGNSGAIPEGWTISRTDGDKNSTTSQHWSGESANRYLDSWNATEGKLKFTAKQTIQGIPNGKYRLEAAVRSSGDGAYLFAVVSDGIKLVEIPIDGASGGGIWEDAEDGSPIKLANDGNGFGWNWMEIADINVNTNFITIGISCDQAVTNTSKWAEGKGTWFSGDDFKLYWTSDKWSTDIENVGVDSTSELVVYAENGYITVVGVENFTILTLDGTEIPAKTQLAPGIYIVKTADKVAKVAVK